jgi:hypothetical protein
MQPIDPHTLFSIFESGDEGVYIENGVEEVLKNPYVLMGIVLKGLENWMLMDELYKKKYPEQYKEVRNAIRWKYNIKLYGYLTRIDLDTLGQEFNIGESFPLQGVANGLNHLIRYYERYEEYERCAVIKKYYDYLLRDALVY